MKSDIIDAKEKILLEYTMSSGDLFSKVLPILKPEYFTPPLNRVVEFVLTYHEKYKACPSTQIIHAETGITLEIREGSKEELQYVSEEIEGHIKREAMRIAILEGADIVNKASSSDYDFGAVETAVKNALMISLDTDLGINQLMDDVALRHEMMQLNTDSRTIGWKSMDDLLEGVRRGELGIFAGSSGTGKSVVLANVAVNMARSGMDVLLITIELNQDLVSKRMDAILTGTPIKTVYDESDSIQEEYQHLEKKYGRLQIKKLRNSANANDIRSFINEYTLSSGKPPDVLCLDYLDLLSHVGQAEGRFDIDKLITEQLRDVMVEYNLYGFTASQLNRSAVDQKEKTQANIAGGKSKIDTCDFALAIVRDQEHFDRGVVQFQVLKLRNAEGGKPPIELYWNRSNLRITDESTDSSKKKAVGNDKNARLAAVLAKSKK